MANLDAKINIKGTTVTGATPTVAPSNNYTDGTWSVFDIGKREPFLNLPDARAWVNFDNQIKEFAFVEDLQTTYFSFSGGTVTGATNFTSNLSATTYYSGSTLLDSLFARTSHVHTIGEVTGLQTHLNNKADLSGSTFTGGISASSISATTSFFTNAQVGIFTPSGQTAALKVKTLSYNVPFEAYDSDENLLFKIFGNATLYSPGSFIDASGYNTVNFFARAAYRENSGSRIVIDWNNTTLNDWNGSNTANWNFKYLCTGTDVDLYWGSHSLENNWQVTGNLYVSGQTRIGTKLLVGDTDTSYLNTTDVAIIGSSNTGSTSTQRWYNSDIGTPLMDLRSDGQLRLSVGIHDSAGNVFFDVPNRQLNNTSEAIIAGNIYALYQGGQPKLNWSSNTLNGNWQATNIFTALGGLSTDGVASIFSDTTNNNVLLGNQAGASLNGNGNFIASYLAGYQGQINASVAVGASSLRAATGTSLMAFSSNAGQNYNGLNSSFIGNSAGFGGSGNYNTYIGDTTGENANGDNKLGLDRRALRNSTGSKQFGIGAFAGENLTASNTGVFGPFYDVFFNGHIENSDFELTPHAVTLQLQMSQTGTNKSASASTFVIAQARGTDNASGGNIIFQKANKMGTSDGTRQTLSDWWYFNNNGSTSINTTGFSNTFVSIKSTGTSNSTYALGINNSTGSTIASLTDDGIFEVKKEIILTDQADNTTRYRIFISGGTLTTQLV